MDYDDAVVFIKKVLRSVNVNADQHDAISRAFNRILEGPPIKEPKDGDNAVQLQRPVQPSQ
jgi:hypothetical protein